ncbi:MAG TPA: wax ester/triacylglycerol synthase family O-acyltransferase, partial [Mycobacterium sp.]|nr:wax ester/triacylglycerol synthase family O-acyltransferase [Mycobacterium sp.]
MKRLRGWDAVLLYSETSNVHMHTLKLAVIQLDDLGGATFGVEELRKVIHSRLYKLDPFRWELVDIPFKFHHPMWRENAEVDLEYHVRSHRVDPPGGRRQLDEAVGRLASTPLDRSRPLWEMYLLEGLADGRIAVLGKIHHALADGVASANLLARGMDMSEGPQGDRGSYATEPPPTRGELIRTAFADHMRQIGKIPSVMRYTAQGVRRVRQSPHKLSPELTRPFTPPPSFMNHMLDSTRKFATATLALADVK